MHVTLLQQKVYSDNQGRSSRGPVVRAALVTLQSAVAKRLTIYLMATEEPTSESVQLVASAGALPSEHAAHIISAQLGSPSRRSLPMPVAQVTEILACSKKSFQDAIEIGVKRACKTLKNVESALPAPGLYSSRASSQLA